MCERWKSNNSGDLKKKPQQMYFIIFQQLSSFCVNFETFINGTGLDTFKQLPRKKKQFSCC